MARQKYHFLTVTRFATGLSVTTLPGQMLGLTPVTPGILVKDRKKQTVVQRMKKKSTEGTILFTSTLKRANGCYTADDIHPLHGNEDVMLADAIEEYEKLYPKGK